VASVRAVDMLAVVVQELVAGWYSSADAVPPPATRTSPSPRSVAVAPARRTLMGRVGANVLAPDWSRVETAADAGEACAPIGSARPIAPTKAAMVPRLDLGIGGSPRPSPLSALGRSIGPRCTSVEGGETSDPGLAARAGRLPVSGTRTAVPTCCFWPRTGTDSLERQRLEWPSQAIGLGIEKDHSPSSSVALIASIHPTATDVRGPGVRRVDGDRRPEQLRVWRREPGPDISARASFVVTTPAIVAEIPRRCHGGPLVTLMSDS